MTGRPPRPIDHGFAGPRRAPRDVPATVRDLVAEYGLAPREINAGNCDEFAWDLAGRIGGNVQESGPGQPAHLWVMHRGRLYDAECPDGVRRVKDLPFFRRCRGDGPMAGTPPGDLTAEGLSRRLRDNRAHDLAGPLDKRQTDRIARCSRRWVLVAVPVTNLWDTAPGGRSFAPPGEPIVVHVGRDGEARILDGQHRYAEANRRGEPRILAYVPEGQVDALGADAAPGAFPAERSSPGPPSPRRGRAR